MTERGEKRKAGRRGAVGEEGGEEHRLHGAREKLMQTRDEGQHLSTDWDGFVNVECCDGGEGRGGG